MKYKPGDWVEWEDAYNDTLFGYIEKISKTLKKEPAYQVVWIDYGTCTDNVKWGDLNYTLVRPDQLLLSV